MVGADVVGLELRGVGLLVDTSLLPVAVRVEAMPADAGACAGVSTISVGLSESVLSESVAPPDVPVSGAARGHVPPSVAIGDEGRVCGVVCAVACGVLRSRWALMRGSVEGGSRWRASRWWNMRRKSYASAGFPSLLGLGDPMTGAALRFACPRPSGRAFRTAKQKAAPQRMRDGLWGFGA